MMLARTVRICVQGMRGNDPHLPPLQRSESMIKKLYLWIGWTDWALPIRLLYDPDSEGYGVKSVGIHIGPILLEFAWGEDFGVRWEEEHGIEITD
jgi:hypothetical protein